MHFPRRTAGVRRISIVGIVTALAVTFAAPGAYASSDPLRDAQNRITAAQESADRAAAAYDAAQTTYYTLEEAARTTRGNIASLRATQHGLSESVVERVVALYMRAGETDFDNLLNGSNVLDAARRATLGAAANAHDDAVIGRLRATTQDLDIRQASLRSQLADAKTALDQVRSEQQSLEQSLNDARQAEQDLRGRLERERRASEFAARSRRAEAAATSSSSSSSSSSSGSASSSSPVSTDQPGQIIVSGEWVCPVQGPVSFTDTFGAPRSGHTHKGVDMFAARGYAVGCCRVGLAVLPERSARRTRRLRDGQRRHDLLLRGPRRLRRRQPFRVSGRAHRPRRHDRRRCPTRHRNSTSRSAPADRTAPRSTRRQPSPRTADPTALAWSLRRPRNPLFAIRVANAPLRGAFRHQSSRGQHLSVWNRSLVYRCVAASACVVFFVSCGNDTMKSLDHDARLVTPTGTEELSLQHVSCAAQPGDSNSDISVRILRVTPPLEVAEAVNALRHGYARLGWQTFENPHGLSREEHGHVHGVIFTRQPSSVRVEVSGSEAKMC